jgi:ketosteroid isomerase-like protein
MKKLLKLILSFSILSYACNTNMKEDSMEKWKREIVNTEKEFAEMAVKEGIPKAFLTYAAEDVVLMRNNTVLKGKEAIKSYFENQTFKEVKLEWAPDFVDVSSSGDLGYTYGPYTFTYIDINGKTISDEGIFHTVWKRQADGKWLFVWD